jgi:hypothetical protein
MKPRNLSASRAGPVQPRLLAGENTMTATSPKQFTRITALGAAVVLLSIGSASAQVGSGTPAGTGNAGTNAAPIANPNVNPTTSPNMIATGNANANVSGDANANASGGLPSADLGISLMENNGRVLVSATAGQGALSSLGLRTGDQIIAVNGQLVTGTRDLLSRLVGAARAMQNGVNTPSARLTISRNGRQVTVNVSNTVLNGLLRAQGRVNGNVADPNTTNNGNNTDNILNPTNETNTGNILNPSNETNTNNILNPANTNNANLGAGASAGARGTFNRGGADTIPGIPSTAFRPTGSPDTTTDTTDNTTPDANRDDDENAVTGTTSAANLIQQAIEQRATTNTSGTASAGVTTPGAGTTGATTSGTASATPGAPNSGANFGAAGAATAAPQASAAAAAGGRFFSSQELRRLGLEGPGEAGAPTTGGTQPDLRPNPPTTQTNPEAAAAARAGAAATPGASGTRAAGGRFFSSEELRRLGLEGPGEAGAPTTGGTQPDLRPNPPTTETNPDAAAAARAGAATPGASGTRAAGGRFFSSEELRRLGLEGPGETGAPKTGGTQPDLRPNPPTTETNPDAGTIPAIPATPATPGIAPATPATPATPAVPRTVLTPSGPRISVPAKGSGQGSRGGAGRAPVPGVQGGQAPGRGNNAAPRPNTAPRGGGAAPRGGGGAGGGGGGATPAKGSGS